MELAKRIARCYFEELGFHVYDIPEAAFKRADLDVNDGSQQYLIEVKEKLDTGSQLTVVPNSYPDSDRVMTREPHVVSDRIDGILKKGRKQLNATPGKVDALRLLFLRFTGPNANMFVRRSLYTFYGVQDVAPDSSQGEGQNCVYFHNSFAYSSPSVDGLIVMENWDLQLCLNEFSAKCDVLRNSHLAQKMGKAVYDPARFDEDNGKIVLRSSISRTDERQVLNELERITGVKYHTVTLHRYTL